MADPTWFPFIKPILDVLKSALKFARNKYSNKKYNALLSTIIAELLKEHPDINTAKAKLLAFEATGSVATPEYLKAKDMMEATDSYIRKMKVEVKKKAGGLAAKKKAVVSKKTQKRNGKMTVTKKLSLKKASVKKSLKNSL